MEALRDDWRRRASEEELEAAEAVVDHDAAVIVCPACGHEFPTGPRECPDCGLGLM